MFKFFLLILTISNCIFRYQCVYGVEQIDFSTQMFSVKNEFLFKHKVFTIIISVLQ